MTTSSPSTSAPPSTGKRTIKRKLDESILKKARTALGLPQESRDDEGQEKNDEPSLKWRKPRHNTVEGQIYVKNKEKRKRLELEEQNEVHQRSKGSLNNSKKEDKKKGKKRRKKKAKNQSKSQTELAETTKNPESEKRHGMEAISYVQLWATNRDHWKFEKRKQTWLLKNCLNSNLIDDTRFETLLEYVGSIKGIAKQTTLTEMQSLVTKFEMAGGPSSSNPGESKSEDNDSKSNSASINETMYDRARQIIQVLVDE